MRAVLVMVVLATTAFSTQSRAACLPTDITALTYSSTALRPTTLFRLFSEVGHAQRVGEQSVLGRACGSHPSRPAQMTGAGILSYDLQSAAGGGSILYQGGNPAGTVHVDIPGSGTPGTATLLIALQPGQIVADGAYADTGLTLGFR